MVRKTLGLLVAVVLFVGLATPDANAGWGSWGSHGSSGGSWGSHGSSGGSWGSHGSSGGSWGSHGSSGGSWGSRGYHRVGWRRHRRYAHHSSGGSWGSHGSSGGSWGSHGSSGGSWGSHGSSGGSSGGTVVPSGGTIIQEEIVPEAPPAEGTDSARNDRGVLTVSVPKDAKITVNGNDTTSMGSLRRYVSKGLDRGFNYRYEVSAVVDVDGEQVERTQVATLRAGRTAHLEFDFTQVQPVETRLTLNVPEDAQVFLSGVKTKSTGQVRNFVTTKIADGEKWAEYHVVVTVERNGQKLSKEQDVSLSGGDDLQLSFSFDQTELAAAR